MKHNFIKIIFFLLCILPKVAISQLANSPWPMYQHDSRHTGKSEYSGVRNPMLEWSYEICDDSWTVGDITIGTDETIYVPVSWGTGMGAYEGFLYAINPNGTFKWQYQFEGICVPAVTVPAIAIDSTIYVHVNGNANIAAQERIYAINPDGTKKWEYLEEVAAFVATHLSSPVIADDGSITYSSTNTASTRISSNGEWLADLLDNYYNSILTSPALISGDTIYIKEDAAIKAYYSTGGLIWATSLPGDGISGFQGSPSIDKNGTIYYSNPNTLYALSLDGSIKWTYALNTSTPDYSSYYSTPAISSYGPIVSTERGLFAVNNDGSFRWKITTLGGPSYNNVSPTVGNDDIIYWRPYNTLYIIDDGDIISEFELPHRGGFKPRQSVIIMPDSSLLCINNTHLLSISEFLAMPDVPILLNPSNGSTNQHVNLTLNWKAAKRTESYELQVSTVLDFSNTIIDQRGITSTSQQVIGLDNGTAYYWRVNAKNEGGTSEWSKIWSFRTIVQLPNQVIPISPLNSATVNADTVQFVWKQSEPEVIKYWFEIARDSTFVNPDIDSTLTDTKKIIYSLVDNESFWWRVKAKNAAGWGPFSEKRNFSIVITTVHTQKELPRVFRLFQNYPNPFNLTTTISYELSKYSSVKLSIYDINGKLVKTLINEQKNAGYYSIKWITENVSSGIYFYRIDACEFSNVKKCLIVK